MDHGTKGRRWKWRVFDWQRGSAEALHAGFGPVTPLGWSILHVANLEVQSPGISPQMESPIKDRSWTSKHESGSIASAVPLRRKRGILQNNYLITLWPQSKVDIWGLSGKSPAIVNIIRTVYKTSMNPAAKENGLERACVNKDDFTVLVSGGSRHRWMSMSTLWPSHSKWLGIE